VSPNLATSVLSISGLLICACCLYLIVRSIRLSDSHEKAPALFQGGESDIGLFEGLVIQSLRAEWLPYLDGTGSAGQAKTLETRRAHIRRLAFIVSGQQRSDSDAYEAVLIFCAALEHDVAEMRRQILRLEAGKIGSRERAMIYIAALGALAGAFGGVASVLGALM
jgi:hypothetical protein